MTATYLFLPTRDTGFRWARVADGALREGEGVPADLEEVIAVAPADMVALHWADLPARSRAQATAAARLLAADASATPVAELHVAVGEPEAGEGRALDRPIGVVGVGTMQGWLADLARIGVDPQALVPAPMLLPPPAEGYARAELGGQGIVRGPGAGFADDPMLTALVTGGVAPATLEPDALAAALANAPVLDLRQGPFARRRRVGIDWPLVRRLGWLALAALTVTLAIGVTRIVRYSLAADRLEARTEALARQGLARGETVTNPDRQLDERLARLRGPGRGFTAAAAAVFDGVQAVPGAELTGMTFDESGTLRLQVAAERESVPTDLLRALERRGLRVTAGTFTAASGRVTGEMTVFAR